MRFASRPTSGIQVFAVSGINTVSFGIDADPAARAGLLGFAVERWDPTENDRRMMQGYKVFRSLVGSPGKNTAVSTRDHPVQSFVWDDFTAKPDRDYEYSFYPIKGRPANLDRSAPRVVIKVHT